MRFLPQRGRDARREDEERLLKLYWNRAELKKGYSELRKERAWLNEQLKEKDAEIGRAHEQLDSLESMLTNPASALNAVVHFQLRALWRTCHQKLTQLASELRSQQEERERRKQTREYNQDKQKRLKELDSRIEAQQALMTARRGERYDLAEQVDRLTAFWLYFKRRKLQQSLDLAGEAFATARTELNALRDERARVEAEPWPGYPGLSLESRRTINAAVIALAQQLFIHFAAESLALMAKAAMQKPVHEMGYGSIEECNRLIDRIGKALAGTTADREYAKELRQRGAHILAAAKFRKDGDAAPIASSIGSIGEGYEGQQLAGRLDLPALDVNVLAEDYWDVYRALIA